MPLRDSPFTSTVDRIHSRYSAASDLWSRAPMVTVSSPYEGLKAQAAARPERLFIAAPASAELPYAPDGLAISFATAFDEVEALRRAYAAAGYGHGACVALLLENRPAFVWHWLALNALGVSIMPINPDLRVDDLAYQFAIAEPDLAVALGETHALIRTAWGQAGRVI